MEEIRIEPSHALEDRLSRLEKQLKTLKKKTVKVRSRETRDKQILERKTDKAGNLVGFKNISLAEKVEGLENSYDLIKDKVGGVSQKINLLWIWNLVLSTLVIALSVYMLLS